MPQQEHRQQQQRTTSLGLSGRKPTSPTRGHARLGRSSARQRHAQDYHRADHDICAFADDLWEPTRDAIRFILDSGGRDRYA